MLEVGKRFIKDPGGVRAYTKFSTVLQGMDPAASACVCKVAPDPDVIDFNRTSALIHHLIALGLQPLSNSQVRHAPPHLPN